MAALDKGAPSTGVVEHLGVRIDRARQTVSVDGRDVTLTPTEYRLLQFLIDKPDQVRTRQELLAAAIGGGAIVGQRTIDVHVHGLRRKLAIPQFIQTVRGVGYVLRKA